MNGRLEFLAAALLPVNGEFCCLSYRMSCYLVLSEIFLEDFVIGSLRMQEFIHCYFY